MSRGPSRQLSAHLGCSPSTHTAIFGPGPRPNIYKGWEITCRTNPPHGFLYTAQDASGKTLQAGYREGIYRLIDKETEE